MSKIKAVISLKHMNEKGVHKIIGILSTMGYIPNTDFRINYSENNAELTVLHHRLRKDLRLLVTLKV